MDQKEYVIFKLQGENYGIEVEYVENIEKYTPPTRVPFTEPAIKGVVNLRGNVIPVLDMRTKFGLPEAEYTDDSRMLVVNYDEGTMGFLVDSSSETYQLDPNDIDTATSVGDESSTKYIKSIGKKDGRVVMLIDIAKVLGTEV